MEYREGDMDYENNMFAFKRTQNKIDFKLRLISVSEKREIWTKRGSIIIKSGRKIPTQLEIDKLLVDSITKELDGVFDKTLALN